MDQLLWAIIISAWPWWLIYYHIQYGLGNRVISQSHCMPLFTWCAHGLWLHLKWATYANQSIYVIRLADMHTIDHTIHCTNACILSVTHQLGEISLANPWKHKIPFGCCSGIHVSANNTVPVSLTRAGCASKYAQGNRMMLENARAVHWHREWHCWQEFTTAAKWNLVFSYVAISSEATMLEHIMWTVTYDMTLLPSPHCMW